MVGLDGSETEINREGLRQLYTSTAAATAALDYFGRRQKNSRETTVDRLQAALAGEGHDVSRGEIVELFRQLQQLGCGTFVIGRKGRPSRFEWAVGLTEVGRSAAGERVAVEPINVEEIAEEEDEVDTLAMREHRYWLRPGLEVRLVLPQDLTPGEAGRLADFLRTLPIT